MVSPSSFHTPSCNGEAPNCGYRLRCPLIPWLVPRALCISPIQISVKDSSLVLDSSHRRRVAVPSGHRKGVSCSRPAAESAFGPGSAIGWCVRSLAAGHLCWAQGCRRVMSRSWGRVRVSASCDVCECGVVYTCRKARWAGSLLGVSERGQGADVCLRGYVGVLGKRPQCRWCESPTGMHDPLALWGRGGVGMQVLHNFWGILGLRVKRTYAGSYIEGEADDNRCQREIAKMSDRKNLLRKRLYADKLRRTSSVSTVSKRAGPRPLPPQRHQLIMSPASARARPAPAPQYFP